MSVLSITELRSDLASIAKAGRLCQVDVTAPITPRQSCHARDGDCTTGRDAARHGWAEVRLIDYLRRRGATSSDIEAAKRQYRETRQTMPPGHSGG